MGKQTINIGSAPNDGTGDPLRDAFDKVNDNFDELYAGAGGGSLTAVHQQTFQQNGKYIGRDGVWRDPMVLGNGALTVGASSTISNDSRYLAWPVICRLNDGRLFLGCTSGADHHTTQDGTCVGKFGTENPDGTITWGSEFTIYNHPSLWTAIYGVSQISTGRIFATLWRDTAPGTSNDGEAGLVYSDDDGATWSAWVDLHTPSGFTLESFSAGHVVELTNGDLIVPIEGANTGEGINRSCKSLRSTDGGTTWGSAVNVRLYSDDTRPYYETNFVLLTSGRILAVHRNVNDAVGDHYINASDDNGATWGTPWVAFEGMGKPNCIQLSTGTLIATTRQHSSWLTWAYTSVDDGETWIGPVVVDASTDDMMYAATVELFDGRILCVYSLERSSTNADILQAYLTETKSRFRGIAVEEDGVEEGIVRRLNFTGDIGVSVSGDEATVNVSITPTGSFRGALVKKSANLNSQNLTSLTPITWNTDVYDTDTIHDTGSNTSRLSVPSGVTKARVACHVLLNNVTANQYCRLFIFKNGDTANFFDGFAQDLVYNDALTIISLKAETAIMPVTGGTDYFEAYLQVESDTSVDFIATACWFSMEVVE